MRVYVITSEIIQHGKMFNAANENDAFRIAREFMLEYLMHAKPQDLILDVTDATIGHHEHEVTK